MHLKISLADVRILLRARATVHLFIKKDPSAVLPGSYYEDKYMNEFMRMAVEEAENGIRSGHGGPFGCVIVKEGKVIGRGHNEVIKRKDPTCHGEVMAIRAASKALGTFDLNGCELYTTAEPCPMCFGAIRWANIKKVYYGCNIADTDSIGFRDREFYLSPADICEELDRKECLELFEEYRNLEGKTNY